jgi:hypothetical protein
MTKEELAAKLNGREYDEEMTTEEEAEAKASGLVVIFGASDDLMELRGAIDDEIGGMDTAYLTPKGLPLNKCKNDRCPYFAELREGIKDKVTGVWTDDSDDDEGYADDDKRYRFVYKTDMPHASFDIMDNGQTYCRGIVVDLPK